MPLRTRQEIEAKIVELEASAAIESGKSKRINKLFFSYGTPCVILLFGLLLITPKRHDILGFASIDIASVLLTIILVLSALATAYFSLKWNGNSLRRKIIALKLKDVILYIDEPYAWELLTRRLDRLISEREKNRPKRKLFRKEEPTVFKLLDATVQAYSWAASPGMDLRGLPE